MDVYQKQGSPTYRIRISKDLEAKKIFFSDLRDAVRGSISKDFESKLRQQKLSILCMTGEGSLAVVQGEVEIGDRVFVARGATYPFILRPVEADGNKSASKNRTDTGLAEYRLIGGAFVDGIMDGEVIAMVSEGKVKEESIFLV